MEKNKILLGLAFSLMFISQAYAWDWKDFKEEAAVPFSTDAKYVTMYGSMATIGVLIFEDQIVDPVQAETVENKPLGSWSQLGDWAGQLVPNGLYVVGQTIAGASGDAKGYQRATGMFKATAYAASVTTVLKYTVREQRPNEKKDRNSFPSGHTTTAFAFGGYVFEEHGWKWGVPALAVSLFSGISRINDNKHFLHDVLAGATIGLAYGVGMSKLQRKKEKLAFMLVPILDADSKGVAFVKEF